ncbi:MAG: DUF697 domain-containing protein [Victivallales bacterium]|nr:DUF697 domain-containing protein [Victivallales bacterium]MBR4611686.1 DUF697 domain-containing protein [Kiritimatiellia bacterium]
MTAELKKAFFLIAGILGAFLFVPYLSGIVTLVNTFWPVAWSSMLKGGVVFILAALPFAYLVIKLLPILRYSSFDFEREPGEPDTPQFSSFYRGLFQHVLAKLDSASEKREILEYGLQSFKYQSAWDQYTSQCKTECDKLGREYATLAATAVVISPVGSGDLLVLLFWNLRMIHKIIDTYKIRPSFRKLMHIYGHVLFSGLVASSLEELLSTDTIDSFLPSLLHVVPGKELILQSGYAAFSLLRTCHLAQVYLTSAQSKMTEMSVKKEARKYAAKQMPQIIKDTFHRYFSKKPEATPAK